MIPSPAEITYFFEVATIGSLSRAADKLDVSQPSVTMAIKRLEKAIGTSLFVRHKHGISLTPAGKKFLHQVKPLLLHWRNTRLDSLASHHEVEGEVTLGCHAVMGLFLHKFLPDLLDQYPHLSIQLKHDVSQQTTLNVINSTVDIGVVLNPIKHPDLILRKLNVSETTFWTSTAPRSMQDIHSNKLTIICDPNLPHTQTLLKQWKKAKYHSARIMTSNSLEIVANLTANGCGIGILPSCFIQTLYPKQLSRLHNAPMCSDDLYLIYRKESKHVKAVMIVLDVIKTFLTQK